MRKTLPILVAVLLLGAGVAIGWFASTRFSGPATSPQPGGKPAVSFGIGDPEVLTAAPSWETWEYPGSKMDSSTTGGRRSTNGVEIGVPETIALVTPDEFDKVWAFYKEKCQLLDLGDNPSSFHRFEADHVYNVKLFDDIEGRSFAGPKSDVLTTRAFTVHSWRYQLVGFVYRPKGESTCVLLVYRPNVEFVRMLRDQVVKE
jgi:hypothetical protein